MTLTPGPPSRRHAYHVLKVADVVDETAEARSLVLDPGRARDEFVYRAGQFLTVRLRLGFERYVRCYSLSSCPASDELLKITVKRVPEGKVSNFLNTMMKVGYQVEAMPPSGDFVLADDDPRDLVAFASGSGITPVISIMKTALITSERRIRLFFANRSRDAIIFAAELDALARDHADRLEVVHHIYDEVGYLDAETVLSFLGEDSDVAVYVCGSRQFTAAVDEGLARSRVPGDSVRHERFAPDASLDIISGPLGPEVAAEREGIVASSQTQTVTIGIRGGSHAVDYLQGTSLLDTARRANLTPPFACGSGICAACIARVVEGEVTMPGTPAAIEPDEIADGWVLTCQAIPVSRTVSIEYPD